MLQANAMEAEAMKAAGGGGQPSSTEASPYFGAARTLDDDSDDFVEDIPDFSEPSRSRGGRGGFRGGRRRGGGRQWSVVMR